VQVWDADFGRIAVLICFDINYFEVRACIPARATVVPSSEAT
jgi:predicted amidohydrolase